jgi:hypothetical protein
MAIPISVGEMWLSDAPKAHAVNSLKVRFRMCFILHPLS